MNTQNNKKRTAWNKGLTGLPKASDETRAKMSQSQKGKNLGKVRSEQTKRQISETKKAWYKAGGIHPNQGKTASSELREKMSKAHIGYVMPESQKQNISEANSGEKNYQWITDRTVVIEKHRLRNSKEWKEWRKAVFSRDNYTCQECHDSGVYIEPNHIIPLRLDISRIFNIDNGITLCKPCHIKTYRKEEQFSEKYTNIVLLK